MKYSPSLSSVCSPRVRIALLAVPLLAASVNAEVALPAIFSDHMVLQREKPVRVWGTATPNGKVTVEFGNHRATARPNDDGAWEAILPAMEASAEPRTLVVRDDDQSLRFEDVLVGEVWLASGQSNMEKPLGEKRGQRPTDNYCTEIAAADHPNLRLFQVPHYGKVTDESAHMRWLASSPETIKATEFSAAAYFFARELLHNLGVPIGIIHSSFGGTMIEAWTPATALKAEPELANVLEEPYFAWVDGVQATELYQSMIEPLVPYTLRGFIWYQGEANAMNGETEIYTVKMRALIEGWRNAWKSPDAPFYYVQLAPFNYSAWDSFPAWLTPEGLPLFWEAQTAARAIPHTGMVVTTDLAGNTRDIHPTNKRDVGLRLAHLALVETYEDTQRVAHSPSFKDLKIRDDGSIALTFTDVGNGLARGDGDPLSDFQIADESRVFVPAQARIIAGDTVIVSSSLVENPIAVRFAWHETATPNLVNSAGLPAIPFRTDDWPVINVREKPE